ncbi:hypothetical protein KY289_030479 [Solanum tuberosum]|nr:hypothetical protein KY289_030479 [Solanum tuberosum]
MSRLQKNRDNMMNHNHKICPRILLKLEQNKDKAAECIAIKSDEFHYQIEDSHLRLFSVDLKERTCSCRNWDLTRIPCNHAITAIWVKKDEPEKNNQSEVQQQQVHQKVRKEGSSTLNNETEVSSTLTENMASIQSNSSFVTKQIARQLNQPRAQPQIPLRSSAFILEEINEHSRKGTRPYLIQRMGKQYVPLSSLQEALSQTSKRVGN